MAVPRELAAGSGAPSQTGGRAASQGYSGYSTVYWPGVLRVVPLPAVALAAVPEDRHLATATSECVRERAREAEREPLRAGQRAHARTSSKWLSGTRSSAASFACTRLHGSAHRLPNVPPMVRGSAVNGGCGGGRAATAGRSLVGMACAGMGPSRNE